MLAVAAVSLGISACGSAASSPATSTEATAFVLPRLNGSGEVRLADLRGHPVVVNFFASWCTACRGELPILADVSRRLRGRVTFAGVNAYESGDGMAMARSFGIDWWPLARDVDGAQDSGLHDNLFAGKAMPITAFYDATGRLLYVNPGALTADALRAALEQYAGVAVQADTTL